MLTAYADTDAAIAAINEAGINHYLLKPWDPPEENLYPVLDELLEEWEAAFPPQFEGIRVLGNRWSPVSHGIKDFLARNHVPYQWLDIETAASDSEVRSLVELLDEEETRNLPIVILPNGVRLDNRHWPSLPNTPDSKLARPKLSTISQSSAVVQPVWPRRSMARAKDCEQS